MVTIDIIKHSASIAFPAGRLRVHTEDDLSEKPETRDNAIIALKNLATLLRQNGIPVMVVTHNKHDSLLGEVASA